MRNVQVPVVAEFVTANKMQNVAFIKNSAGQYFIMVHGNVFDNPISELPTEVVIEAIKKIGFETLVEWSYLDEWSRESAEIQNKMNAVERAIAEFPGVNGKVLRSELNKLFYVVINE